MGLKRGEPVEKGSVLVMSWKGVKVSTKAFLTQPKMVVKYSYNSPSH